MYVPLKIHCCSMLWEKHTMSVIYADTVWHHSQSFRIMVKGWKWDPHIWYDVLYNWPSTHKISCKYLNVDQSYDGMHLFPHWTTLYVMHERHARILSFHWRPFWKFLMAAITRTRWCILTFLWFVTQLVTNKQIFMQIFTCRPNNFKFSVAAILKILNGGYHKNQVICPDILYDLLHSWPSIHQISCKYSHVDQIYSNFEFSVAAILKKINGAYYKNQVICP